MTDASKVMNLQYFGSNLVDTWIWIRVNPEISVRIPDDFWLRLEAEVYAVWTQSGWHYCNVMICGVVREQWSAAFLYRESWQGDVAASQSHVLQSTWPASVPQLWTACWEDELCYWGNWRLWPGITTTWRTSSIGIAGFLWLEGSRFQWVLRDRSPQWGRGAQPCWESGSRVPRRKIQTSDLRSTERLFCIYAMHTQALARISCRCDAFYKKIVHFGICLFLQIFCWVQVCPVTQTSLPPGSHWFVRISRVASSPPGGSSSLDLPGQLRPWYWAILACSWRPTAYLH